jgi:hypothetical protein
MPHIRCEECRGTIWSMKDIDWCVNCKDKLKKLGRWIYDY